MRNRTIAFLGPAGTYTEQAAVLFDPYLMRIPCRDFSDVLDMVHNGKTDVGVIAIENMIQGMVRENLDLIYTHHLHVQSEILMPIRHALCALKPDTAVKEVLGHPQALAQCRKYLKEHYPLAVQRETTSTAAGIQEIASHHLKYSAAIGSAFTAAKYGLPLLSDGIEDVAGNVTRFWVVGKQLIEKPEHDKFSLAFYFEKDKPGCLHQALAFFAEGAINLTCITSRPSLKDMGNYVFHIDLDGNLADSGVQKALDGLRGFTDELQVIGSYLKGKPASKATAASASLAGRSRIKDGVAAHDQ